ncbi:MAG: chemotaxis protein, partial [Erythrobacter sp.]
DQVGEMFHSFSASSVDNEQNLRSAHTRMMELEMTASVMFDRIVQAGLAPTHSFMAEKAKEWTREIEQFTEAAMSRGEFSMEQLYDVNYREVAGSNPKRYTTQFTDWAHEHWRPILDRIFESDPCITAAICTDMNGYKPTHLSQHARQPTGDLAHDTLHCRQGRIILDPVDKQAKASDASYMMGVARFESDGQSYDVIRMVYVPFFLGGKRWGNFEIAYVKD